MKRQLPALSDSPEDFIAAMLKNHPRGFTVTAEGHVIGNSESTAITDFKQLGALTSAPKELQLELPGKQLITIKVRALNSRESSEHDKIDAGLLPPKKAGVRPPGAKKDFEPPEDFDFDDPEYLRKRTEFYELKRAFIIDRGVVGFKVPGETLEEKRDFLATNFPPRIIEALRSAIAGLTSDPIETAAFI